MKMKETNLSKYQHQTDKYKTKKNKIEAARSHSISRRVAKKRDSFRAYESDHEVDYKKDSLGERGFEQDKYKAVEQSQERCSRPRGRLQLRLNKVKQGEVNEAAETVSECNTAVESNTKLTANESRHTGSDLVCVYNVTDSDVDDDNGRQKLNVLMKKYRTSVNTEQNVHKGCEQSKQEKEDFEIDGDEHDDECVKYSAVKGSADVSSHRRHKSREMEQNRGRSSKWKRRVKCRNMSFSESESEFEVEEEQDLCKTFRRVRSRRSRIAGLKKSAECGTAEGETEKLDESELKTSDDESEQDNSHEELDENQTGNVECKFCQKVFVSDDKLDNHYMIHFKTVEGLNTFLNQRRQQKCLLSSRVNSSSILKHSANSNSRVKKKVVFEMDVDEGVDCRSPEINNCEIIDLLSDGDYTFESGSKTYQAKGELDENVAFLKVKKEDEIGLGEKLRPLVATTDYVNDSAGVNEIEKFTINVDGERLYCTHNIEMAKSCLQKNVKIVLTPLKFMNEKSVRKAVTEMNVKDYEVGLMNEHWSVAKKLVENDNSAKLTNIRAMNENSTTHDKGALKLTLSKKVKTGKGNDQKLGKKSSKKSSSENARHRSDLKRGSEKCSKAKTSVVEKDNTGNITMKTNTCPNESDMKSCVSEFDLNRSLDRGPSKDSKIKKKGRSRSVESGSKNFLNMDSIKKDLIDWTKEFERMKTLTENIAKSKLLDPNIGKDKSLEMINKVGNTVIRDASKKRSKKHKTTKREKEDKTFAEQSRKNDSIDHSAKQGKTESSKKRKVKRESCSEKLSERSDKLHGKTVQKAEQSNEVSGDVQYIHGKMSDSAGGVSAMASETQTFKHKQKCGHSEGDLSNYSQVVSVDKDRKTSEAKEKMLNSSTNLKFSQKTDKSIKNTSWTERSKKIKSDNMQIEKEKKKIVSTAKMCKEKHTCDQNEQNKKANLQSVEKGEVKKNSKRTGLSEKGVRNTAGHRKGRKRLISKEFVSSSEDSDIEGKPIGKTDLKTKSEDKEYEILAKENEVKNDEVNQCMEHSEVKNSHLIRKDEETSVQHGENPSYIEKSKNKLEKNNLERKYEVQGNLEKIQSYIISRKDYFAKKYIEDSASRSRDVKGRFKLWSGTDEDKGIYHNSRINEQLDLLHKNRITDVLKIGSEISSESFDQNNVLLMEPPTDDDTKIYDSCYDEILIEFAEDVDIVLNSPDKAALMFDESALYNDLEKLSSKDSINSDDITHSTEENRVNNVESAENIDGQTYVDIKDKECRNETQSACKSDTHLNRTSVEDLDKIENSLVIASSELQANDDPDNNQSASLNLTGLSPKIEKKRKRNGENNSHVEVPKEKAKFETEFSQKNVVQIHSRHMDKFETEKLANSENAKKGKQTRIIELPEIVLRPRKERNLETEPQLKIKEKLEEVAETAVDQVDAVEEMGQPVEKGVQELNIFKKHDENRTETNLKQNVGEKKNETENTLEAERGSSLNSEFISKEVNPKHKKRKHSHCDNSGHKHKHRKTEPSEIENENTVTEIVEIRSGESIETQNSSGSKHNDVSRMLKHSLNEVQRKTDDVTLNKFYRCEKCNKLFHGVPNFDLKSCVSCAEKLAENSDGYKYNDNLEESKLADVKDSTNQKEEIQQNVESLNTNADSKIKADFCFNKADDVDPTNSSEDVPVQIKESPKSYQSTCSSDKQKKLKLVIQKMKMSSFKSVDYKCKFTGSPEQPQWKVKNFEMNETPLKLTLTNAGDGTKEVNDFAPQDNLKIHNSEQVNTGNSIHSEIKESAGKLSEFMPRKEAENLKSIKDRKTENITSRTDGKSKKSENSVKKGSTLKVEPKGNKSDHLKKKNQCSDAPNEFEKALWKEHEMKTKEKSRKKDVARSKVKREHPHNGKLSNTVDNRTLLFKERRCNWSFSSNDPVQHFQKSKIAQMIYNKRQKEIVDDGLPDFSDAKLDLGSLPPLCVSAKNLSVTNGTNKGNDIYSFSKEINLSESSSSSAASVSSSTAEASRMNTDVKTAAFASVTEATDFSKVSDTVGSSSDKVTNRCSGNVTEVSASATTGFARSLESDQAAIDFNKVRTNGVSSKTIASDNRNEENNAKHLKDLKKELEAIVMHKDNKLKDLMMSFTPGSAFSPPWSKEKNEKVSNHSTPILPSFSETFSKNLSPLPVNQNKTFPGFTNCDNVPGFNASSKSFGTESSYSDDESAFTELSEHGIDTDKKLDKQGVVSVFDRLGKRKLSEESNSTIVPLQGQNSSPVKTDNVSPVYSPKVPELTVAEHQEEIKDFSSTPAVKSSSSWNARSDEHRLALDISCISRCSSGVSEESSDVPKQKRRKITRLEIPECAFKGVDVQEKKNNIQDSQMPSMLILSAECSQMDMTNLQGSIVSKSLEEEQTKVSDLNNIKDLSRHAETDFSAGFEGNETGKESDISVSSSTVKYPECLQVGGGLQAEDQVDNKCGNSIDDELCQGSYNKTMVEENIEESSSYNKSIANIKEKTGEYFRVEDENEKELVASLNNDTNSHVDESERITKEYENEELDIDLECKDDHGEYDVEVAVEGVVNVQNYEVTRNDTVSKLTENIANVLLNGDVHTNEPDDLLEIKESAKSSRTEESVPVFTGNVDIGETENETEEHFTLEEISEAKYESDRESEVHTDTEETRDTSDSEAENTDTEYEEERETPDSEAEDLDTGTEVDEVEDRESIDTSKSDVDTAEEEVIDDVLELYASDEEASFLLDSAEPSPPTPCLVQNKAKMEIDKEESKETRDMELETNSSLSDTTVIETNVPVNVQTKIPANVQTNTPVNVPTSNLPDHLPTQPCEVPVFQPIRNNPIKTRWLPTGWCFRYFNRKPCSVQCTFRHDNPTEEVLSRCLPEIVEKCKKGELNSGMNMLESQSFFMNTICQDDLDCLYGYSVNHLNMEYCHKLLQLIANRNLVKQGHIDDIIYLWKRIVYCEDIAPLKDAFYIAKEKNIYPQHRAVLVLLEAFSAYSDGYMLWDVILYCTQQEDLVIPQQFINKAVTMLIACGDMSLVSAAVAWLEKASPEQLSNINNEPLSTLGNKLQQGNMGRIASSVRRCLQNKRKSLRGTGQQNIPRFLSLNQVTENTVPDTGQPAGKQFSNVHLQRRPVTPTNVDLSDLHYSEPGKAPHQLNTNIPSRAVTPVNLDSADISWDQVPQLLTAPLQSRTVTPTKQDSSASRNRHKEHQSLSDKKSSREVTQTKFSNSGSSGSNEQVVNDRNILEEMKTASETSNWQELADLFIHGCKTSSITPEVFEQLLLALTRDDSIIGEVWREFIQHIKQKQIEDPDLRLDSYSLSILGSEIFYFCRRMGLRDAGDILLVILDTEFLSLSQFVSHRWNVNLELEAAEFLSNIGMAGKAAELVLEFSSSSLESPEVKTRLWNILLPLTEQLCTEESYTLAFQIFCMAFMWKYRGLRKIASDVIESCLRVKLVDVPIQIYELYITDSRKFDIRETVKRSLLNALVETKIEDGKRLFLEMKRFTAGGLFLEQSYEKPRCIWIQFVHTCNEIKLIIGQYLDDLYNQFCGQIAENITLTSEDLFLEVAINKPATQGNPVGVPYVGTAMVLPSSVKMILLSEFGIESDLSRRGAVKVTVCPASLEKYLKNLDLQGHNVGLEFSTNDLVQNMKTHKIKR